MEHNDFNNLIRMIVPDMKFVNFQSQYLQDITEPVTNQQEF